MLERNVGPVADETDPSCYMYAVVSVRLCTALWALWLCAVPTTAVRAPLRLGTWARRHVIASTHSGWVCLTRPRATLSLLHRQAWLEGIPSPRT